MDPKLRLGALFALLLGSPEGMTGQPPATVSPGEVDRIVEIDGRCPTFSFGGGEGGLRWDLVVYELGGSDQEPVFRKSLPASIGSYTASEDECLAAASYAWSLRALGASEVGEWSAPRLFRVSERGPDEELAAVIGRLQRSASALGERSRAAEWGGSARRGMNGRGGSDEPRIASAGGAPIGLRVDGGVEAALFLGDGSGLANLPPADDVQCSGCVSGADVANNSLTTNDIANGTVGSLDLGNNSVGARALDTIRYVGVECRGECEADLETVCGVIGSGWEPIAVDCSNVSEAATLFGTACGVNTCLEVGDIRSISLFLCDDISGGDANVMCIRP